MSKQRINSLRQATFTGAFLLALLGPTGAMAQGLEDVGALLWDRFEQYDIKAERGSVLINGQRQSALVFGDAERIGIEGLPKPIDWSGNLVSTERAAYVIDATRCIVRAGFFITTSEAEIAKIVGEIKQRAHQPGPSPNPTYESYSIGDLSAFRFGPILGATYYLNNVYADDIQKSFADGRINYVLRGKDPVYCEYKIDIEPSSSSTVQAVKHEKCQNETYLSVRSEDVRRAEAMLQFVFTRLCTGSKRSGSGKF